MKFEIWTDLSEYRDIDEQTSCLYNKDFQPNLISNFMIVKYEGQHELCYSLNDIIMNQIVIQDNGKVSL